MDLLQGLHGTVGVVVLCALLFAEEAGVPLPFAPGEVTLLAGGLLVASGAVNPFVFGPLAVAACVGGAMLGYSWARLVGERGLTALAIRLHQGKRLDRVAQRIRHASPWQIALSRLIIGLRIYTTLVAGAFGVSRRAFLAAVVPATVVWVAVFTALGALIGIPVEHLLNAVSRIAIQGAVLLIIAAIAFFALRRSPKERGPLVRVPYAARVGIAAAIDAGVVASVVAGVLAVVRRLVGAGVIAGWVDVVAVVGGIAVFYIVLTRWGTGATVGEALLNAPYVRRSARNAQTEAEPRRGVVDASLDPLVRLLHGLDDPDRLRVALALLQRDLAAGDVAALNGLTQEDAMYRLAELEHAQVIEVVTQHPAPLYRLTPAARRTLSALVESPAEDVAAVPAPPG